VQDSLAPDSQILVQVEDLAEAADEDSDEDIGDGEYYGVDLIIQICIIINSEVLFLYPIKKRKKFTLKKWSKA
jgi:hypothetical protein